MVSYKTYTTHEPVHKLLNKLNSSWSRDVALIQNEFMWLTHKFYQERNFKTLNLSIIVDSPTCQEGFGSDSKPVVFLERDNKKYLSDSMQFLLEYGCRLFNSDTYCILPSYRDEKEDSTHLYQYYHSEAEVIGNLDNAINIAESYIKYVSKGLLEKYYPIIKKHTNSCKHIEDLCGRNNALPKVKFNEIINVVGVDNIIYLNSDCRRLSNSAEEILIKEFNGFVWISEFDTLSVPFFQAIQEDSSNQATKTADLLFGVGEVIGLGERHLSYLDLLSSLKLHNVDWTIYNWYIELKKVSPLLTSGYGMGVERYMCWLFNHYDVRDFTL